MIGQHQELSLKKLLALHFSGIGCITFRDSSFFYITLLAPFLARLLAIWRSLPAVALALPAVLQQQQLVASPLSFLLAFNIFTVQPRNVSDSNTLTPTVGLQLFSTARELLCQL